MTEREAFEFENKKKRILGKAGYRCIHCGGPATELAHRAARTVDNALIAGNMVFDTTHVVPASRKAILKNGYKLLNHEMNLDPTCSRCNSKSNLGHQTEVMREHLQRIIDAIIENGGY